MKLYTKEQVIKAIDEARFTVNGDERYSKDEILDSLTPIELPSDKEIEKKAWEIYWEKYPKNMFSNGSRPDLVIGYVRFYRELKEQILNQNNLTIKTDGKVGLSNPNETTNNKLNINQNK